MNVPGRPGHIGAGISPIVLARRQVVVEPEVPHDSDHTALVTAHSRTVCGVFHPFSLAPCEL